MINVFITGSGGMIGKQIYSYLSRKKNIFVIPILRRKSTSYKNYIYWDYFKEKEPFEIQGKNINTNSGFLIHCGFDFSDRNMVNNSNCNAVKNLLSFFNAVKIINISTMSAYEGCLSIYGKNKLAIEKYIELNLGFNLRMGVPITRNNTQSIGFLGIQKKINNFFPFFTFAIDTQNDGLIYLSYIPIFNNVIYKILINKVRPGTYSVVFKNPVKMIDFISTYTNKKIIKIDWRLIYIIFRIIELSRIKLRFGSDSVIGLVKSTKIIENPFLKK